VGVVAAQPEVGGSPRLFAYIYSLMMMFSLLQQLRKGALLILKYVYILSRYLYVWLCCAVCVFGEFVHGYTRKREAWTESDLIAIS
jgi:hypothetical protein